MKADIQGGGDDKRQRGFDERQEAPDTGGAASSGDAAVSAAAPLRGSGQDHKRRAEEEPGRILDLLALGSITALKP